MPGNTHPAAVLDACCMSKQGVLAGAGHIAHRALPRRPLRQESCVHCLSSISLRLYDCSCRGPIAVEALCSKSTRFGCTLGVLVYFCYASSVALQWGPSTMSRVWSVQLGGYGWVVPLVGEVWAQEQGLSSSAEASRVRTLTVCLSKARLQSRQVKQEAEHCCKCWGTLGCKDTHNLESGSGSVQVSREGQQSQLQQASVCRH